MIKLFIYVRRVEILDTPQTHRLLVPKGLLMGSQQPKSTPVPEGLLVGQGK
jgi:hypothetical protein